MEAAELVPKVEESEGFRQSRIKAVFLTHGHGDHCVGLVEFSTGQSFKIPVYGPPDLIHFLFEDSRRSFFYSLGRIAQNYVSPPGLRRR